MEPVFNEEYMRKREHLTWRAPYVVNAIDKVLRPKSVVDVGCSIGEFVQHFTALGVPAVGIDNSQAACAAFKGNIDNFWLMDIANQEQSFTEKFDLAMCFEVGGILTPMGQAILLINLIKLSDQILFGIEEPRHEEWKLRFKKVGFEPNPDVVKSIRSGLEPLKQKMAMKAIYYGMMFFQRK
jgi:SAM-dependent methyltransferase